jgi:dihydroxy-acid dehydratase
MAESNSQSGGLRSRLAEYGDQEFAAFLRRSFVHSMGLAEGNLEKSVIGIVNTFSELNHCHLGLNDLAAAVKRGVSSSGGLPLEFPVISLGEQFLNPSAMMFRNLMSMDVEAMLKAQPIDGVVLLGGCDKTLPALLMGAASANIPSIVVAAGPMLASSHEGERIGACTDCRRFWASYRRGEMDESEIHAVEKRLAPTHGTCGVMGTASTMACVAEALGMMLPGTAAIPAVYSDRIRAAEESGMRILKLVKEQLTPSKIMTQAAIENACRVLLAIGGSTNAVIHLTAIAGRLGIRLDLDRFDSLGKDTPVLVAVKPSGPNFMEDFHRAGGVPVVMNELRSKLSLDTFTVTGENLKTVLREVVFPEWQEVIYQLDSPFQENGSLVVLRGNLAPRGALLKRSAASSNLLHCRGRAVVFESLEDLAERIDSPDLDVNSDDILVLKNAGLLGGPGMPEAGNLPIPRKLSPLKDMVRISDARMSGTGFGTIVLHISPEAAVGGPLALVENGDMIELDVDSRRLHLDVSESILSERKKRIVSRKIELPKRGYERLFFEHVQQADLGADFDFLRHPDLADGDIVDLKE